MADPADGFIINAFPTALIAKVADYGARNGMNTEQAALVLIERGLMFKASEKFAPRTAGEERRDRLALRFGYAWMHMLEAWVGKKGW